MSVCVCKSPTLKPAFINTLLFFNDHYFSVLKLELYLNCLPVLLVFGMQYILVQLNICFLPFFRYMRHAYGLGEHYNSVKLLSDATTENGS